MKKVLVLLSLSLILILPIISAEATIIFEQQPKSFYNLGERLNLPIMVASNQGAYDFLTVTLLCDIQEYEFPKDSLDIAPGELKKVDKSVLLIKRFIGETKGACKIKAGLENEPENYIFSNDFTISSLLNVNMALEKNALYPSDTVSISGTAIRENGKPANGMVEIKMMEGETVLGTYQGIVNNGAFITNFDLNENIKAGEYDLTLSTHEVDPVGEITNKGYASGKLTVNQKPTSLEVIIDNENVEPGTNFVVRTILHDQTGEKIEATTNLKIKNGKGIMVQESEIAVDESFEFPIVYNEAPADWSLTAKSEGLEVNSSFKITEKESVIMDFINNTLTITNNGNVPYNKTTMVKIGEDPVEIEVYLKVDESQSYKITAPDGNYVVEVISGENRFSEELTLTGKAIDVRKASGSEFIKYSFVWIFIILILAIITFIVFKRGYQRTFIGYISARIKERKGGNVLISSPSEDTSHVFKSSLINPKNRAEISLSIKGNKQEVSITALNIKNLKEIESQKSNAKETLQKIVESAEEEKASVYESNDTIFFILAPEKTKTFKNEKTALNIAKKAKEILVNHNKLFQQKISFGISLNQGPMIVKQEKEILKFMSLGTLMANTKKIAGLAKEDVLLSEKMNDKLISHLKTSKQEKDNLSVYSIKEIKNNNDNKDFLKGFLKRNTSNDK